MKKIGIIGGMGPLATVDLYEKIIRNSNVKKDQDHFEIFIHNNPNIPDRTKAILSDGISPVEEIINSANKLKDMGSDFLCMPCNTAFYFYNDITKNLDIDLVNIIDVTIEKIIKNNYKNPCVLGTKGTIYGKTYYNKLDEKNMNYQKIDDDLVNLLDYYIYEVVKKDNFDVDIKKLTNKLDELVEKNNVDCFVLACTELPILFEKFNLNYNVIDTTEELARRVCQLAKE